VVDAPLLKEFVFTDKEREPMAPAPAFIEDSYRFQKASIAQPSARTRVFLFT